MKDLLTKELPEIAEVLQDGLHFREKLLRALLIGDLLSQKFDIFVWNESKVLMCVC